jgi:hypothetical protein
MAALIVIKSRLIHFFIAWRKNFSGLAFHSFFLLVFVYVTCSHIIGGHLTLVYWSFRSYVLMTVAL